MLSLTEHKTFTGQSNRLLVVQGQFLAPCTLHPPFLFFCHLPLAASCHQGHLWICGARPVQPCPSWIHGQLRVLQAWHVLPAEEEGDFTVQCSATQYDKIHSALDSASSSAWFPAQVSACPQEHRVCAQM